MWTTERSIEATGSPGAIWRVWADVASWMEMSGPAADTVGPELGPAISADLPEALTALGARARR